MDILFIDDKRDDTSLKELVWTLRDMQDLNIPVFLVAGKKKPVLKELEPYVTLVSALETDQISGAAYDYPLSDQSGRISPALAMYREYCKTSKAQCSKSVDGAKEEWGPDQNGEMWVFWKTGIPARPVNSCIENRGVIEALYFVNRRKCPPQTEINVANFNEKNSRVPSQLIEGKFVFYGTQFFGVNGDLIEPVSVQGIVAGVFKHAMAFDNLVAYGDEYYSAKVSEKAPLLGDFYFVNSLIYFLNILTVSYLLYWFHRRATKSSSRFLLFLKNQKKTLSFFVVLITTSIMVTIEVMLDIIPANMFSLFGFLNIQGYIYLVLLPIFDEEKKASTRKTIEPNPRSHFWRKTRPHMARKTRTRQ